MNTNLGLIGTKLGTTQIFDENGIVHRVTVIQAGPNVVLGKRTIDQDGYSALIVGFGTRTEKHVNKPEQGFFKKNGQTPAKLVREFRFPTEAVEQYSVGQEIKAADVFREGHFIDVTGVSKGRGYTGVMKRHGFKGSKSLTHGNHEGDRRGGSIGMNMTPGRTLRGQGMPGQYGAKRTTKMNLKVVRVMGDEGLILVRGSVPGSRNGVVTVRLAVKKIQDVAA
ncbi:MAG: 50S ribosomal protein L3 [Myxococcota bacterium]